jgi:hypothetical protein
VVDTSCLGGGSADHHRVRGPASGIVLPPARTKMKNVSGDTSRSRQRNHDCPARGDCHIDVDLALCANADWPYHSTRPHTSPSGVPRGWLRHVRSLGQFIRGVSFRGVGQHLVDVAAHIAGARRFRGSTPWPNRLRSVGHDCEYLLTTLGWMPLDVALNMSQPLGPRAGALTEAAPMRSFWEWYRTSGSPPPDQRLQE